MVHEIFRVELVLNITFFFLCCTRKQPRISNALLTKMKHLITVVCKLFHHVRCGCA